MITPEYHRALIRRGRTLQLAHVPTTSLDVGGLQVALSYVGVCGTDLQILNGSRPDTAEILGHEGVGVVVKTAGVGEILLGEQVVFNPAAQLSEGRILGHNTPGIFQEYITLEPQAVDDGLVMVAKDCSTALCGILVEPLACIVYAHALLAIKIPDLRTAVVLGAGPVGILAVTYLKSLGVKTFLIHPDPVRLQTVERLGIAGAETALMATDNVHEQIVAGNDGRPVDAALICTTRIGAPSALRQAIRVVRDGGCIDLVTNYPESETETPSVSASALRKVRAENVCGLPPQGRYWDAMIAGRQVAFTGHRGTSHAHLRQAMSALRRNEAAYTRMITHVLPLDEAADAIQTLSESRSHAVLGRDCIKLAIDMSGSACEARVPRE